MKKQAFVFLVIILFSSLFCASLCAEPLDDIKEFLELDQEEDIPSSKKVVWFPEAQGQHTITWASRPAHNYLGPCCSNEKRPAFNLPSRTAHFIL